MKNLVELSELELLKEIKRCDLEITKLITQPNIDFYPGAIMGLGDFYVEKSILIDELLRRKSCDSNRKS